MGQFIYQIEKKELEEHIELNYYSINEKKETILNKSTLNYSVFIKKEDFEQINTKSDNIILTEESFFNKNKEKVVKINFLNKEIYSYFKEKLRENKIETYEEDFPEEHKELIFGNKCIFNGKNGEKLNLKTLSLDIETIGDVENQEIILLSTHSFESSQVNRVYISLSAIKEEKKKEVIEHEYKDFKAIFVKNEKELLERFKEDCIEFNPQLIIGWNVIDFDFKVIKEKMKFHSIEFNLSKYEGQTKMRIAKDFFGKSNLSFPGILVFDAIQLLKTNFISFEDYKLNTVAKEVLKDEKINLEDEGDADLGIKNKIHAIENMLKKDPIKLIEYNFKDSYLTSRICKELSLIDLTIKRSIITNTPLLKVQSPIATLDIMYLKELHKKNIVAPTNFNFSETGAIEGAFVLDPKAGFYEDIFVFDFKSLYPSIIMTFNIDPFTYKESNIKTNEKGKIEEIIAPNGAKFNFEEGIMPQLIKILSNERDIAKKEKDKIKSQAIKTTMNSFYGALASPKSRFHNREIGEAITSFGREIMLEINKFLEKKGFSPTYNDTDSTFVKTKIKFKNLNEKTEFASKLEKEINLYFKEWVAKKCNRESFLLIEFEKIFSKFFIASKKRYVGYDELSKEIMFTGMEAIRGDWTELGKKFQIKLVELIFNNASKKEIENFILKEIEELKEGKFDKDLIYKKKITKPLKEYTKTTPPHVKAARELEEFSGKLVKYVMLENGPKHISLIKENDKFDYEHYIEKQLKGVSDDLLEHINIDFDEIIYGKKQKNLSEFF